MLTYCCWPGFVTSILLFVVLHLGSIFYMERSSLVTILTIVLTVIMCSISENTGLTHMDLLRVWMKDCLAGKYSIPSFLNFYCLEPKAVMES